MLITSALIWKVLGFLGQSFFSTRILIQWWASEQGKQSIVPTSFWFLGMIGGTILFAYSYHIGDIVFICGHGLGLIVYARNIWFIYKRKAK